MRGRAGLETTKTFFQVTLKACKGHERQFSRLIWCDNSPCVMFVEVLVVFLAPEVHALHRMLSTSDFAAAVGISESSVRRLADGGLLEIHRTRGGHRRIPIAEAIRYVRETGAKVVRPDLLGLVDAPDASASKSFAERLLDALSDGHASGVIGILQSMYASGVSIASICDQAIGSAIASLGELWPNDNKAIFLEHRATLLCVRALCQLRLSIPDPDEGAPTAMGGAPQDDPYLLPTLMASLVLHDVGFEETNLGPNTPLDVLADSVEDEQPQIVWLAMTNPLRSRTQSREIERIADVVAAYGGRLLIGGAGAGTYQGGGAERCSTMHDLAGRAGEIASA